MHYLDQRVEGFRGLGVRRDGQRLSIVFRWFDDPNTYEISSEAQAGPWSWEQAMGDLVEELDTNYLMRAIKTREGTVLRAELDGQEIPGDLDTAHYISAVISSGIHLARDGLDVRAGTAARRDGVLLDWWAAYVNTRTGGPAVGQLVTVRRPRDRSEAEIAHLELVPQTPKGVGHDLVFTAIHHAARHGIQRLYGKKALRHLDVFGFAPVSDAAELFMYDITTQDLNWPEQLRTRLITRR